MRGPVAPLNVRGVLAVSGCSWLLELADLAKGTARKKRSELIQALHGRVRDHHRRLLKVHLTLVKSLQDAVNEIDTAVGKSLAEPLQEGIRLLTTMPGMSDVSSRVVVAEIGVDMTRFPTDGHLLSWATFCPRNDESAGKRRSTRVRKGGTWRLLPLKSIAYRHPAT